MSGFNNCLVYLKKGESKPDWLCHLLPIDSQIRTADTSFKSSLDRVCHVGSSSELSARTSNWLILHSLSLLEPLPDVGWGLNRSTPLGFKLAAVTIEVFAFTWLSQQLSKQHG